MSKKKLIPALEKPEQAPLKLLPRSLKHHTIHIFRSLFWFGTGFVFAAICVGSLILLWFENTYQNRVIPGVYMGQTYVGGKTEKEVEQIFINKNKAISTTQIQFSLGTTIATVSAAMLSAGYDTKLAGAQSISIGKSSNIASNVYSILAAYINGIYLQTDYTYSETTLKTILAPIEKQIHQDPIDAQFNVQNNRVTAFQESKDGKTLDYTALENKLRSKIPEILKHITPSNITIMIPLKILKPTVSTEKANNFGIVQVIGQGTSFFAHSIPGRIHNVVLAASRVNGILVAPNEEFSFDKYLGDVSAYTGYQQAYVIQNGHTVLGDGGGVCQVSTTLFRAILNAGLPITERHGHSYRVGYYEEASPPGIDATVFYPSVDLKFKNDTGHYILVESTIDLDNLQLSYTLYGRTDGRTVAMTQPIVTNQTPAPPDLYQDDPTLPKGTVKQVDFAAAGATTSFTRTVTKNGKTILADTYRTVYTPWQAIYLRGTQ